MQELPVKFGNIVKYLQGKSKTFSYEYHEKKNVFGTEHLHIKVGHLTRANFAFFIEHCEYYDIYFNVTGLKGSGLMLFTFV